MTLIEEAGGWRTILVFSLVTVVFSFSVSFGLYFVRGPEPKPQLTCEDWQTTPDRSLADEVADELDIPTSPDRRELVVIGEELDEACQAAGPGRPLIDGDLRGTVLARTADSSPRR